MSDDRPYEVGYGRPPKGTRWAKGQSGNPSGRRKGPRSIKAILAAQLEAKVVAKQGGQLVKLSFLELLIKSLMAQAGKGNPAALRMFFGLMERHGLGVEAPEPDPDMDYKQRKALHAALGRWIERVDKTGDYSELSPQDLSEILYAADSDITQIELPLSGTSPSNSVTAPTLQLPAAALEPTDQGDDDVLY